MNNDSKICKDCKLSKPLEEYSQSFNKKYQRYYYQSICKPCSSLRSIKWWHKNKDKVKARKSSPHYKAVASISHKRWAQLNPELINAKNHRYLANKNNAKTFYIRESFLQRLYKSVCVACGSKENIVADHIIPLSRGGDNSEGNLQPLCHSCNCSKKNKTMSEWINK